MANDFLSSFNFVNLGLGFDHFAKFVMIVEVNSLSINYIYGRWILNQILNIIGVCKWELTSIIGVIQIFDFSYA